MRHPVFHRHQGFTLVEVLVAMAIMSLIAIMSWQGVDGIVRSRNISQGRLEELLRINTVLAQWEQDLQAVYDSKAVDKATYLTGSSFILTRRAHGGVQVVVWSLRGGEWKRWAGPPVTSQQALQKQWRASQQFIGTESGQLKVLSNVTQWQLYSSFGNTWSNFQSDSGSQGNSQSSYPEGVRLVLTISGAGLNGTVTRDVVMPFRIVTN